MPENKSENNRPNSEVTSDSPDSVDIVKPADGRNTTAIWFTTPLILIVLVVLGAVGYLASAGIDISYAVGTSGWVAPPGSKLAGHDIGGKSFNDVEKLMDEMNSEFSSVSVWLVEPDLMLSVYDGDFRFQDNSDLFALSVAPEEFGLSLDITAMETELGKLEQKSNDILLFKERLNLWNTPPVFDLKLAFDGDKAAELLDGIKSTVQTEPVDAVLDLPNHRVIPSVDGVALDVESTLADVPTVFKSVADIPVELKTIRTRPKVTETDFDHIDASDPLSSYTTNFSRWNRNRSFNIELGASHFEGVVIQPGEIFSFNETTGPRGYSDGYRAAPMYLNHRPEMEPAGGMCQVSTTLYNALLLAGFEIVERHPHSRPCSYVPYGRDATVAYGAVDLKMRNTLDHAVVIHQVVEREDAGWIRFEVFGHPDDRVNVEIGNAYSWIARTESMTEYVVDTSLEPCEEVVEDQGVNGIHQRTWRIWYDDYGNEIRREELTNDHVRPVGAYIRHNPCDSGPSWATDEPSVAPSTDEPAETPPPGNPGIYF